MASFGFSKVLLGGMGRIERDMLALHHDIASRAESWKQLIIYQFCREQGRGKH